MTPDNGTVRAAVLASTLGGGGGLARFARELLRELGRRDDLELVVVLPAEARGVLDDLGATNVHDVLEIRGRGQVDRLTQDIQDACATLDKKGGAHPIERAQVKTGSGY